MMIGELGRPHPTVHVPPWDPYDDTTAGVHSPYSVPTPTANYLAALHSYLPSNVPDPIEQEPAEPELLDEFLRDDFHMYVFKVRSCTRGRSHDWTTCPYAHPGEKARRRDPRRFQYSGTPCPDFRKGNALVSFSSFFSCLHLRLISMRAERGGWQSIILIVVHLKLWSCMLTIR